MQWGGALKLWQKLYEEGKEPPAPFFERPEIEPHLDLHWAAFDELSTERQIGMAAGPIPVSVIRRYFVEQWGFAGVELDHAVALIREVDGQWMHLVHAKSTKDDDPPLREIASASDPKAVKALMRNLSRSKRKR